MIIQKKKKRSYGSHTIEERLKIIEAANGLGVSRHQLSKDLGIPKSTLIRILNEKDKYLKAANEGTPPGRKRLRKGKLGDVETELVNWIDRVRRRNITVTGELLNVCAWMQ